MVTDKERREVARRLRELSRYVFSPENTYELLADAFGVDDFEDTPDLFNRLADLVEPTKPVDFDGFAVDRDALLALADEMETADPEDLDVAIDYVTECASRILETLGDCQRGVSGAGDRGVLLGPSGQVAGVARAAPREGAGEKE